MDGEINVGKADLIRRRRMLEVRDLSAIRDLTEAERLQQEIHAGLERLAGQIAYQEQLREQSHDRLSAMSCGAASYQPEVAQQLYQTLDVVADQIEALTRERAKLEQADTALQRRRHSLQHQRSQLGDRLLDNRQQLHRVCESEAMGEALELGLLARTRHD